MDQGDACHLSGQRIRRLEPPPATRSPGLAARPAPAPANRVTCSGEGARRRPARRSTGSVPRWSRRTPRHRPGWRRAHRRAAVGPAPPAARSRRPTSSRPAATAIVVLHQRRRAWPSASRTAEWVRMRPPGQAGLALQRCGSTTLLAHCTTGANSGRAGDDRRGRRVRRWRCRSCPPCPRGRRRGGSSSSPSVCQVCAAGTRAAAGGRPPSTRSSRRLVSRLTRASAGSKRPISRHRLRPPRQPARSAGARLTATRATALAACSPRERRGGTIPSLVVDGHAVPPPDKEVAHGALGLAVPVRSRGVEVRDPAVVRDLEQAHGLSPPEPCHQRRRAEGQARGRQAPFRVVRPCAWA